MIFQRNIPEWVKRFPSENQRRALIALAKASKGPFEKPREMNFALYGFKDDLALAEVRRRLEKEGWGVSVTQQADAPSHYVITATKNNYQVTKENYYQDSIMFHRLAEQYEAGFDGWFASS